MHYAVAVMSELRRMIVDKSVYVFLNEEADGDYHDFTKILSYLEKYYLDILDREIRSGLDRRSRRVNMPKSLPDTWKTSRPGCRNVALSIG